MKNLLMILIIFGMTIGCKTTEKTTTRTISINDTLIHHKAESISLPTRNITILERPCKQDTLTVFQQITVGNSTLTVSSDKDNNLIIDYKTDSLISVIETLKQKTEVVDELKESETIVIKRTPKWNWYIMGILLALLVLTNLSFIVRVVSGFRIPKLP